MMLINPYRFAAGGDPYFANVSLLLHCDGSSGSTTFTDHSSAARTVSPQGNANINTTIANDAFSSPAFQVKLEDLSTAVGADVARQPPLR